MDLAKVAVASASVVEPFNVTSVVDTPVNSRAVAVPDVVTVTVS